MFVITHFIHIYIYILPNDHHPTVEYLLYIRKLLALWLVQNLELHGEAC